MLDVDENVQLDQHLGGCGSAFNSSSLTECSLLYNSDYLKENLNLKGYLLFGIQAPTTAII